MVTLQVFHEGKGPEDGVPLAKFPLTVKNGSVSAKWSYRARYAADEIPPDSNRKFVFSAHSAWCNFEKSSNSVAVKLVRPEITKVEWQDGDGGATSKGLVGQPLKLHVETKDMEGGVTFHVFDEHKREVYSVGADINGDAADAEWTYHWNGIKLDHKPKFTIEVTGDRCKAKESGECEIGKEIHRVIKVEQYERLFQEGKATLNKVTWLRHADGTCDYDGSTKKVTAANTSQPKAPVAGNTNTNTNVAVQKTMSTNCNLKRGSTPLFKKDCISLKKSPFCFRKSFLLSVPTGVEPVFRD